MPIKENHILISRTDSIGDVILTLPLAVYLKTKFPELVIGFLAKSYTRPIIQSCPFIDYYLEKEVFLEGYLPFGTPEAIIHVFPSKEIAKKAKDLNIKLRVGTSHRLFHWRTCNRLVNFTRKNSPLHESQLNFKLLTGLGLSYAPTLSECEDLCKIVPQLQPRAEWKKKLPKTKTIIFHPLSKGSALDWPLENYVQLSEALKEYPFKIAITASEAERDIITEKYPNWLNQENILDVAGLLTLEELISFISCADGLLACSTGPLHIAASLKKPVIGLYPDKKPMDKGRWGPLSAKSTVLVGKVYDFKKGKKNELQDISVSFVKEKILEWL